MGPRIQLLGELPALVARDGTPLRPQRLTQPWLMLARIALPKLSVSEVPPLPPGRLDAHVRPAIVVAGYRTACSQWRSVLAAGRPELSPDVHAAPADLVRADLCLTDSAFTTLRADLNKMLTAAGHEPIPRGRGPLALPSGETDVDRFFDLLAVGSYREALDYVAGAGEFKDILDGADIPWVKPMRLLLARGLDAALAELACDAEGTKRADLLRAATIRTGQRVALVPRMSQGTDADRQRQRALIDRREGYLRSLRSLSAGAESSDGGQATFLICETAEPTGLSQLLGDHYWELIRRLHALLRPVWSEHRALEVRAEGEGSLVMFGDADDAVDAAIAAHRAISAEAWPNELKVRTAIHSGPIREYRHWGIDVHYAAELCAAAHSGQILVSERSASLIDAELDDLGKHAIRDFPLARRIFHLRVEGRESGSFPPPRTRRSGRTNLPNQLSSFVGRSRQLYDLRAMTTRTGLVTLAGMGGIGKTRLALQLGAALVEETTGGVWLVDLAPVVDGSLVPSALAEVLGVSSRDNNPVLNAVAEAIGDQRTLVVLDNCERVLDAVAGLTTRLLESCRGLTILATSREPLQITGEEVYRVPPLETPGASNYDPRALSSIEAVQLLVARAGAQLRGFIVDARNSAAIGSVCRRLDGIPLAIELAAVRLRSMSIHELDARLDRRFSLLTEGSRTALPHHRTLSAMLDWSYEWLSPAERIVLERVSVFAATGFDLEAAEDVCRTGAIEQGDVLDLLDSLVDKSLIQVEDSLVGVRYRLLETVRVYADLKLRERGEDEDRDARRAHRDHYAALADRAAPHLAGPDQLTWLERLSAEHDNLRAAIAECLADPDPAPGVRLTTVLARFWRGRGYGSEGSMHLRRALERPQAHAPTILRGYALAASSYLLTATLYDFATGRDHAEAALSIARAEDEKALEAQALKLLALVEVRQGRFERGLELSDQAVVIARMVKDSVMLAELANTRGAALVNLERDARASFEESLALSRAIGDDNGVATAVNNLGAIDAKAGDLASARVRLQEALKLYQELGLPQNAANAAANLGFVLYRCGDMTGSDLLFRDALTTAQRQGDPGLQALALLGLSLTATETERAAELHGATDALVEDIQYRLEHVEAPLREIDQGRREMALGPERFRSAYEAGRSLSRSEAVALALRETDSPSPEKEDRAA